jgi:hypothetical protein
MLQSKELQKSSVIMLMILDFGFLVPKFGFGFDVLQLIGGQGDVQVLQFPVVVEEVAT